MQNTFTFFKKILKNTYIVIRLYALGCFMFFLPYGLRAEKEEEPTYIFEQPVGQAAIQVDDQRFMQMGHTSVWIGGGVITEFNDNINLSPKSGLSDIILRPNVYTRILRPIGEKNVLNFTGRGGTTRYLGHSEFNTSFGTISPDSALAFNFFIKEIEFFLVDKFSYLQDATTSPLINKTVNYNRFENSLGLTAFWSINEKTQLTTSISRSDLIATSKEFKSLSKTNHIGSMSAAYRLYNALWVGATVATTKEMYKQKTQNDSSSHTFTADIKCIPSDYLNANFSGGITQQQFKPTGTIGNGNQKSKSFVFSGGINHRLTPLTDHSLSLSGRPRSGYGTNYYSDYQLSYTIKTTLNEKITGKINLIYQNTKTSGSTPENAKRYFIVFMMDLNIFKNTTCAIQARNLRKKSNIKDNSYTENKVFVDLTYSI